MLRTALKTVWAHKLRLALTSLAIILGVGFIAGTFVFTDTINRTFDNLFADTFAGIDVIVQPEVEFTSGFSGPPAFDEGLLDTVSGVDGVEVAEGSVFGFAVIVDEAGDAIVPQGPPTLGGSWSADERFLGTAVVREGRAPTGPGEVIVDARTAEANDLEPGDVIQVIVPIGSETVEVVGTVGFGDSDNLAGATFAGFELREAQRLLDVEGRFHTVNVRAAEGVDAADLRDDLAGVIPDGFESVLAADEAAEQAESLQEALSFIGIAILVFAAVSMFVASFIISNTFRIIVAQRTRELGLLRAVGATGRQVVAMVVVEALVVGLVASVIGLLFGFVVALGLVGITVAFGIDLPTSGLSLGANAVVAGMLVGTVVTVVSSIFPALRAARVPPIAALTDVPTHQPRSMVRRAYVGSAVLGAGVVLIVLGLFDLAPLPVSGLLVVGMGAVIVFIGVAILSVLVVRPVATVVAAPFVRLGKVTGRLAKENAIRRPRRTAATASALMIGLALVGFFFILGSSLRASVGAAIEASLRADYVLTVDGFAGGIPTTLTAELSELPEVAAATPLRLEFFEQDGSEAFVVGIDAATADQTISLDVLEGSLAALADGGVFVYEGVADDEGWQLGDTIEMGFAATGLQELPIVGIFGERDALPNGASYLLGLAEYERNYATQLDFAIGVKVAEGVDPEAVRAPLEAAAAEFPQVNVENQSEFRESQEEQINVLLNVLTLLLVLAVLIALFGITNTLVLSVTERTREIGLLRAVGMSRWQVRRMVLWEAVVVAVLGGLLGAVVGLFFGIIVVAALGSFGITELSIPIGQIVFLVVFAAVVGVIAAIFPARRAARLNILEAIAYE